MNSPHPYRTIPLYCALAAAAQLCLSAATLTNRYSFTSDATDSVGGKNGTLAGGASIAGGRVQLDGTTGYVDLPNGLVSERKSITIEVWLQPESNPDWVRIWDFGNSDAGEDQSGAGITHFMCALKPSLRATIYAGGTDSWVYSAPAVLLTEGAESHVVWTSDGTTHRAQMFVNGVLAGRNTSAMNTPASMGSTFNNWLGRSQFSADGYLWGAINEFRIWDGALSSLEVAASAAAGPDTIATDPGAVTNLVLQVASDMITGNAQDAVLLASAAKLSGAVDIADVPGVTYESSDSSIVSVDAFGRITAKRAGTVTLTARYASLSDAHSIVVTDKPAVLLHRYSFASDAKDSAGTAHGTLQGAASVADGKVVLDPLGESYVELPQGILGDAKALTIETWATFGDVLTWSRLWHFGDQNDAGLGRYYVELCPRGSAEDVFIGASDSDPGGTHADSVARAGALRNLENVHLVAVFNPLGGYDALYVNGALAGRNTNPTVRDLTKVQDIRNYIGRSLYSADPYLDGSVDEVRIFDGALSSLQVALDFASGPDKVAQDPGALAAIRLEAPATLSIDGTVAPVVFADYASLTNYNLTANAVTAVAGLAFASSDTNVLAIQPDGLVHAVGQGTAQLYAVYQGKTSTTSIAVSRPLASLKHRYSFATDATDSIGSANGTLQGNAKVSGGKLSLDGTAGTYVALPGGLITSLIAVTVEFWADFKDEPVWTRVFDFGRTTGNNGADFFFFSPRTGSEAHRLTIATGAGAVDLDSPGGLQNKSVHVTCVYDPAAGFLGIYTNGVLDAANLNARVPLSSVATDSSYIGRSLFTADAFLNATIDEFRVYEGRLYPDEIAATEQLGPDALLSDRVSLHAQHQAGQTVLTWPASATGYTLQFSPVLGTGAAWTAVTTSPTTSNGAFQLQLPLSGSQGYYRLSK